MLNRVVIYRRESKNLMRSKQFWIIKSFSHLVDGFPGLNCHKGE